MNLASIATWVTALFLASSMFAHNVALRLVLLSAGAVLVIAVVARDRSGLRLLPPVWIAFALWGAWAALSLTWSIEPARTLKEIRNEIGYSAVALWACFLAAQLPNAIRVFVGAAALAAVLACGIAIYDFARGFEIYQEGWHGGAWGHSSALLTLMPGALAAGWYAFRAGWQTRAGALIWAFPVLFLASAYTTLNRTIWIGFALQAALLAALIFLRRPVPTPGPTRPRLRWLAVGLPVAVLGSMAMFFAVHAERQAKGIAKPLSSDSRIALWGEVQKRIAEQPVTGYGFGRGLLRESLAEALVDVKPHHLWHSHNLFLDTLLQVGVPGLVLLLLLLGAIVREGWGLAADPDDFSAACGLALVGVVAGMMVRNMTDVLWLRQNAQLFWAVVGVLLAWGGSRRRGAGDAKVLRAASSG